jgi:K+-transporting ATPase ATPase C chain
MVKSLLRQTAAGLRILLVFTVLTGIAYPTAVWAVGRLPGLHSQAEGSIVSYNGQSVGSSLIGTDLVDPNAKTDPTNDRYFHVRPTALSSDPLGVGEPSSSAPSNLSQDSAVLAKLVATRQALIAKRENVAVSQIPADAVTASGSGLDPGISLAYAQLQASRVARVNGLSLATVQSLISANTTGRGLGVLGDPSVNVLELNVAIQKARQK